MSNVAKVEVKFPLLKLSVMNKRIYIMYNVTTTVAMQLYLIYIYIYILSFTTYFGLNRPSSGVSSYAKTAILYWMIIS
jgi:hypothetical protein